MRDVEFACLLGRGFNQFGKAYSESASILRKRGRRLFLADFRVFDTG
jgi:hypothetical protein